MVVADITNPLYPQEISVAHAELSAAGYRMMLFNRGRDDDMPDLDTLRGNAVDGVLFAAATLDSPAVAGLVRSGTPVVLLNRDVDGLDIDRVLPDEHRAGELAARYLTGLGHRRIALLAGHPDTSSGRDRRSCSARALRDLGHPLEPELVLPAGFSHAEGHRCATALLDRPDPPTAVLCHSDAAAYGVLDAARGRGLHVPGDLSVLGFDDLAMSGWSMIRLTTIRQPVTDMARTAVHALLAHIENPGQHTPQRRVFDVELVERDTCGPPR
nr:substrate-binding domain-containing protein [Saccharopolyspora sp. HNM0983]